MHEDSLTFHAVQYCKYFTRRDFPKSLSASAWTAVNGKAEKASTPNTSGTEWQTCEPLWAANLCLEEAELLQHACCFEVFLCAISANVMENGCCKYPGCSGVSIDLELHYIELQDLDLQA